ncbi:unnamed protein product [Acanthoscelides obtectus]|uniref:Uncharacterized protein n=1 Tax=Acanthoscelides obtectus TaxID=200917 RepID=A0A9P0P152_ACAOB|nr:unnamed protein product [Acanthoscelides obtectus]CAK1643717.1 hypothetical protein AOBTE_LOCUS13649 [Acanthoscelides obtectus]
MTYTQSIVSLKCLCDILALRVNLIVQERPANSEKHFRKPWVLN